MFKFYKTSLLLAAVCLMLSSCATYKVSYNYNNKSYDTPEAASAAQKAVADALVSKMTPTDRPVGGTAAVIVPSLATAVKDYVAWRGPVPSEEVKEKALNFTAMTYINDWKTRGDLLEKRRIFDRVVIREDDDPKHAAFSEDVALLLYKKDGEGRWFLRKKNSDPSSAILIPEASTALPPAQRNSIWMDNIVKAISGAQQ
jgi:hypothetical protein